MSNKPHINDLYPEYHRLVTNICRKFNRKFHTEEVEDLSQSCWERVVREYPTYSEDKSALSTWITRVSKTTLFNMLRDQKAAKREIVQNEVSLDQLMSKYQKRRK